MKQFSLFLFMTFIVFACGGGDADTSANGASTPANSEVAAVDAEKLWKVRCMACHGLKGNMGINGAADLQTVDASLAERVEIITNGREGESGVMTAFGEILSDEEIEALARHTMSFNKDL